MKGALKATRLRKVRDKKVSLSTKHRRRGGKEKFERPRGSATEAKELERKKRKRKVP
jgi:hypothetical protein